MPIASADVGQISQEERHAGRAVVQLRLERRDRPTHGAVKAQTRPRRGIVGAPHGEHLEPVADRLGHLDDPARVDVAGAGARGKRPPRSTDPESRRGRDERRTNQPRLLLEITRRQACEAAPHPVEAGLCEERGNALAGAGPDVARAGARDEPRHVASPQRGLLGGNHLCERRPIRQRQPEAAEQPVTVQGVPQDVGVQRLLEKNRVGPRGAQDHANLVVGERVQRSAGCQQRVPMPQ